MIEGILCQTKKRVRSIVDLCEELAYCRLVQNSPIRMIFTTRPSRLQPEDRADYSAMPSTYHKLRQS